MHDWLFIALLCGHLLAVNLAAAGPLVSLVLEWAALRRGLPAADDVARRVAGGALVAFLLGTTVGGAMLGLLWMRDGDPFVAAMLRFSQAKLWFAAAELVFYVVCQAIYVWMWPRVWRKSFAGRTTHRLLAVLAATNLLYHFPPMMVVIADVATGQLDAPAVIDAAAYRPLAFSPAVISRSLHHILAAVALAGLYGVVVAWRGGRTATTETAHVRAAAWSGRLALAATLLQIPVGIWVLLTLDNSRAVMGGDWAVTVVFIAAIVAALGLMHHLAALAFSDVHGKSVRAAVALYLLVVVLMVATLVLARRGGTMIRPIEHARPHLSFTLLTTDHDA